MKFSILFAIAGTYFLITGYNLSNIWGYLLIWMAISYYLVSLAYGGIGVKIFGKQTNGKISLWAIALLLPYLSFIKLIWQIKRLLIKPAYHQITPNIWLGRRVNIDELPENIDLIIDLTCEFPEPSNLTTDKAYICHPTLDADAPEPAILQDLVKTMSDRPDSNIYVHCALGHGRSASVVAAYLLITKQVASVEEAIAFLKNIRPRVNLNAQQQAKLAGVLSS
ncbi:MAG: dual specificity protein phosphatase family protein [Microcoleaceae cyanobacterium]